MGNWLQSRTTKCTAQLTTIATNLQDMQNNFVNADDQYYKTALDGSSDTVYKGQGSIAFLNAVSTDINKSKYHTESLGHVSSATSLLAEAIDSNSITYDRQMAAIAPSGDVPQNIFDSWRNTLINNALDQQGTHQQLLDQALLLGGTPFITISVSDTLSNMVTVAADDYVNLQATESKSMPMSGHPPLGDPNSPTYLAYQKGIQRQYSVVFTDLVNSIETALKSWADALCAAYPNFQNTLQNPDYLSARDLFYYIGSPEDQTQNTNKQITITPYTTADGKKALMISIGGTDTSHLWDSSLITALQTGEALPNNPYMADVKNAIQTYMDEHPEMNGSNVTLAGYSLGGMVAQNWADLLTSGTPNDLTQYNLHVTDVMTYGAPVMGPPAQGVNYAMYDANHDPIPLLARYENPLLGGNLLPLTEQLAANPLGLNPGDLTNNAPELLNAYQSLQAADQLPWNQKVNTYLDPQGHYAGEIYNISDVGNNTDGMIGVVGTVTITFPSGTFLIAPTPGHSLDFSNHTNYLFSNQLNTPTTTLSNINPQTLGPTEYFGLYDN